jgi:hypothetical protein
MLERVMRKTTMVASVLLALLMVVPSLADEGKWEDPRRDRLEDAVKALEEAARTGREPGEPVVALRHGDVRMGAGLARVDVVLEIRNPGTDAIQWTRNFEIDPGSELIGAVLERAGGERIEGRTLTLASARRIYGEVVRGPTRRRTMPRRGDPLRVERPRGQQVNLTVWPVNAGETVQVHLDFVSPLRGHGTRRTFRDVIESDLGGSASNLAANRRAVPTAPDRLPAPAVSMSIDTDWLVRPNGLELAAEPIGMVRAGQAGGVMRFVATAGGRDRVPTLPFRTQDHQNRVIAVPGGGLMTRVAIWRFDPVEFQQAYRLEIPRDATLHLLRRSGSTHRIAPWTFEAYGDPLPVTARLSRRSELLRYAVEIRDKGGKVLKTVEVEREVERVRLAKELEGAITGWHRAAVVRRVLDWAEADQEKQQDAIAYAVDMGVLVPGTAALAVPRAELERVTRASRREYRRDGVPLGAQDGEADFEAPPRGSITR